MSNKPLGSSFGIQFRRTFNAVVCALVTIGFTKNPVGAEPPVAASSSLVPGDQGWPRAITHDEGTIVVQAPRLDRWTDDTVTATFAAAVGFGADGDVSDGLVGSFTIEARVFQNSETDQATLYNLAVTMSSFGVGAAADRATNLARAIAPINPVTLPLTRLLSLITADTVVDVPVTTVSSDPPIVMYRTTPTVLLQRPDRIRTRPFAPGIETVVGVPQPLFKVTVEGTPTWYLFDGVGWLGSEDLEAEVWSDVRALPAPFTELPDEPKYAAFRRVIDSIGEAPEVVPTVIRVDQPAALVVVDGDPVWSPIEGTDLLRATNTTSDLFFDPTGAISVSAPGETATRLAGSKYFLLSSGRWFTATTPQSEWRAIASAEVPAAFRAISADDEAVVHVLASIPGTTQSRQAVARAQIPEIAAIDRADATLNVLYDGAPRFERIENTPMQYAVNADLPVIRVQGRCYAVKNAVWFTAPRATGAWSVAASVPEIIYTIPSDHPLYAVTFVQVLLAEDDVVVCGYSAGYENVYVSGGTVVYGTGYWWPRSYWSSWYWSRWYWTHPPCWGWGQWYDPRSGRYVAARRWVGPYGAGTDYRWDNPRTGWQGAGFQARSPYAQWGRTVATNGSVWLSAGHVTTARGTVGGIRGSGGNRIVAGDRSGGWRATGVHDGNRYVAGNGSLYRRENGSWSRYEGGGWVPVSRDGASDRSFDTTRRSLERQATARDRSARQSRSTPGRSIRTPARPTIPSRSAGGNRGGNRGGGGGRSRGARGR